jgi:predicted DNA-binding transcriptional regulator AlpA
MAAAGAVMEDLTPMNDLNVEQAAHVLGVTTRTLGRWRYEGNGPAWSRLGGRRIVYQQEDIDAWRVACRQPAGGSFTGMGRYA